MGFVGGEKKDYSLKGKLKQCIHFLPKEYELVLGLCPKGPLDWERKKIYIKLRVKPKDGEKKEKKKKGFSLKRQHKEKQQGLSFFLQSFCKAQIKENL